MYTDDEKFVWGSHFIILRNTPLTEEEAMAPDNHWETIEFLCNSLLDYCKAHGFTLVMTDECGGRS